MRSILGIQLGLGGLIVAAAALACGGCDRRTGAATPGSGVKAPARAVVAAAAAPVETDPTKLLFRAMVYAADPAQVDKILRDNPGLINKPINESTPLWMACETGSLPLVRVIVDRGGDLKVKNNRKQSLLWPAVERDSFDVVKYLIEKGLDPKELQEDDETLLWAASSRKMAQILVDAGVDPKHRSSLKDLAIHQACRESRKDVVELLLDLGTDIEAKGRWDMPPLHSAVSTRTGDSRPVVVMLLKRGARIDSRGYRGHSVLHECAIYNHVEMADLLLNFDAPVEAKDDDGRTPMDALNTVAVVDKRERIPLHNLFVRHGAPGQILPRPRKADEF